MAAEIIANELCLNLYYINLSNLVSKYIDETEKDLREIFEAAEESESILFFDEADALLGKRSEVKDSHHRYTNIKTNYLLQQTENYDGLTILATNSHETMDQAIVRRFKFIMDFPYSNKKIRRKT